jgi:putative ABC transport system substrate-binding protein
MKKRITVLALCGMLFALCVSAEAQQAKKIPRIGYLSSSDATRESIRSESIRRALRELGYIEGQNIAFEYRYAGASRERQHEHAAELVRLQVDVIFANSTTVALVAKNVTRAIPTVFLSAADPIASGLVDSLARPGGNLTGFATNAAVLAGKRLELLKETIPTLLRVAILWEQKNQGSEESWKESHLAARQLGLQIHSMEVSDANKFERAFSAATKGRSEALARRNTGFQRSTHGRNLSIAGL